MRKAMLGLFLVFLLVSCGQDKGNNKAVERELLYVRVEKAVKQDIIRTISLPGLTKPFQSYNIVPKQGGIITKIHFEVGDRVKKNQLLVELDTENLAIQKKKAEAQINMAQSNFDIAKTNYDRMSRLHKEKAVSNAQFENAGNAYSTADANLRLAKAFLEEVNQAINDSLLYAPSDGFIANRLYEPGDYINPMMGNVPVMVIHQINRLKILVNVSKEYIGYIKDGQKALIEKSGKEGHVFSVGVSADPASGSFPVEIVLDNQDYQFRPGLTTSVAIVIAEKEDAVAIPKEALYEQEWVFIYKDGIVAKRKVIIDFEGDDYFAVNNGIKESEVIVVNNLYALKDNMKVRVD